MPWAGGEPMREPTEREHAELSQKIEKLRVSVLAEVVRRWEQAGASGGVHMDSSEARSLREHLEYCSARAA